MPRGVDPAAVHCPAKRNRNRRLTAGAAIVVFAAGCSGQPGTSPSPASPSSFSTTPTGGGARTGAEAALLTWLASSSAANGAYFLPHTSLDANGNLVIAGTSNVVVFEATQGGGAVVCTMQPDDAHAFFRIGPTGVMDQVNGPARMTYQRYGAGLVLLEELSGAGKLNVHIQGELQPIIVDGDNGETWTILTVGDRSSAEIIAGAGRVAPAGGGAARDLRCGLRNEAKGDAPRTYIELR
jgi:hypothetical protein